MRLIIGLLMMALITTPIHAADSTIKKPTVFTLFYWWYPLFGAHTRDGGPQQIGGNVDFSPFHQQPLYPVPYLFSNEHPEGRKSRPALVAWYASNFNRMIQAGVDVAIVPLRPDLTLWHDAISAMAEAQKLTGDRLQITFMVDGIEYYALMINEAVIDAYHAALHYEMTTFHHDTRAVLFVYRPELSNTAFYSNDTWLDTLRLRFRQRFGRALYAVLDAAWCGGRYGGRVLSTCNADNYWQWGANDLASIGQTSLSVKPVIISIRPAFAEYWGNGRQIANAADSGASFLKQLELASLQAEWLIIETWNLWEEGSAIDASAPYGALFLDTLKKWGNE